MLVPFCAGVDGQNWLLVTVNSGVAGGAARAAALFKTVARQNGGAASIEIGKVIQSQI